MVFGERVTVFSLSTFGKRGTAFFALSPLGERVRVRGSTQVAL